MRSQNRTLGEKITFLIGNADAKFIISPDNLIVFQGFGNINHPLIAAAPETEGKIFLLPVKLTVYQHIQVGEHLLGDLPGAQLARRMSFSKS